MEFATGKTLSVLFCGCSPLCFGIAVIVDTIREPIFADKEMGAGPSKGCGGGGGGGAGLSIGAAIANAAMREANRPGPEEMRRNPERAFIQHMAFGGNPVDLMLNLARARANQGEQSSSGSTTGGGTSGKLRTIKHRQFQQPNSGSLPPEQSSCPAQNSSPVAATSRIPSSETNEDVQDIRDVAYHFVRRLTRFVRLGGIGQYVTDQTGIQRANVFYEGCSEHQDRRCSVPGHHAAHVVRVRINGDVELEFPEIFEPLRTFVGHTHFVPQYANVWRGLGGEIDRIQERFLQEISTVDFRGELTSRVEDILRRLKQAFLDALGSAVRSGRYNAQQVRDLNEVIEAIREITIRELFEKGRDGLNYILLNM
ncbi:hypothetical protein pipiens_014890 [Culex pipiens pipiens]|uniref:Uncharacterized protein n=1 Tax=Culex pipiens pipiens TaxID=38569 RepID=A0ABD1CSP9_CULPP